MLHVENAKSSKKKSSVNYYFPIRVRDKPSSYMTISAAYETRHVRSISGVEKAWQKFSNVRAVVH